MYKKLYIDDFRLFKNTDIVFGQHLTVLAGRNSTGKSTILGLVANSGQLSGYHTYTGAPFKAEFSELFRGSQDYDQTAQHRLQITVDINGTEYSADFRTAWQKYEDKTKRFRIIPKWLGIDGKETESKFPYPVIYLGLSRLYPVGESKYSSVSRQKTKWDCPEDESWFAENYSRILTLKDEIREVRGLSITGISHKHGSGVKTATYDEMANSAGQDNVGQILLALLSFKKLKRDMGDDYSGGILLIDELDATLHPFAQEQLIKLFRKECRANGIQVVFTTHSMSLLEIICKDVQNNNPQYVCGTELYYFTTANGPLACFRNPSFTAIQNDLSLGGYSPTSPRVGVFSEDAEARHFLSHLIKGTALETRLELVDCSFGCDQLMKLYVNDFPYIRDRVIVFDGDVRDGDIEGTIPKGLRESGQNIVRLPGNVRPEKVIYDFLCAYENDEFWNAAFSRGFLSKDELVERGPESSEYANLEHERNRYKQWYNDNKSVMELMGVYDAYKKEHAQDVHQFLLDVTEAHNAVAERTSALPMKLDV